MGIDILGLELSLGLALGLGEPRGVGREHWGRGARIAGAESLGVQRAVEWR